MQACSQADQLLERVHIDFRIWKLRPLRLPMPMYTLVSLQAVTVYFEIHNLKFTALRESIYFKQLDPG